MRAISHWIGGKLVPGESGRTGPVWDPATGLQQAEVALASAGEVDTAVAAAHEAFPAWRLTSLSRRSEVLFRTRELIGQAQGILMERERLTADQAFDVQRRASQHMNIKLREVAETLVATGESPLAAPPPAS